MLIIASFAPRFPCLAIEIDFVNRQRRIEKDIVVKLERAQLGLGPLIVLRIKMDGVLLILPVLVQ